MAILAMPEHGQDARGTTTPRGVQIHHGRNIPNQPHLVGAGLALPSFSSASGTNHIQGQGKPSPYEMRKATRNFDTDKMMSGN